MRHLLVNVGAVVLAAAGMAAEAGWPCRECRGAASAAHEPFAGRACGPRVWGPCLEPVGPCDQCDACARFHGCNGYRQMPEWLAPWQMPPGGGFQPPEAFGYRTAPCAACAGRGSWRVRW